MDEKSIPEKKQYAPPQLIPYGDIVELTQGIGNDGDDAVLGTSVTN